MLFLLFQLGDARFALAVDQVAEVLPLVRINPMPLAPAGVAGVFECRGALVPVVDACEVLLGRPEAELASETLNRRRMRFERQLADTGEHLFALDFAPEFFGRVEYRMRAFPQHDLLTHPFEMGMMVWV